MKTLPLSKKFASLKPDTTVYLTTDVETRCCTVKSLRKLNKYFLLSFHDIINRDEASRYRGALLSAITASSVLSDGEFLCEEIIGLNVITSGGADIGRVVEIIETAGHDVYVVRNSDKEYLIPAVKEVIKDIQIENRRIIVKKMDGLFD